VWAADFETPEGSSTFFSFFLLFLCSIGRNKQKQYLQAGALKSAANTVHECTIQCPTEASHFYPCYAQQSIQYMNVLYNAQLKPAIFILAIQSTLTLNSTEKLCFYCNTRNAENLPKRHVWSWL
jgi:hypothetical protein